jgi:hypothetical protein
MELDALKLKIIINISICDTIKSISLQNLRLSNVSVMNKKSAIQKLVIK